MKYLPRLVLMVVVLLGKPALALEFNTSPFLTATSEYKFYTANVLFDKKDSKISWGPTMGMGLDSDVSLMFLGARLEYTQFNYFYGATGAAFGFLQLDDQIAIATFPYMYSVLGMKYQYSNYVTKFGIGMMSSDVFAKLQDKSILSQSANEKTMVPTVEIKLGYRF